MAKDIKHTHSEISIELEVKDGKCSHEFPGVDNLSELHLQLACTKEISNDDSKKVIALKLQPYACARFDCYCNTSNTLNPIFAVPTQHINGKRDITVVYMPVDDHGTDKSRPFTGNVVLHIKYICGDNASTF